jgi:hypothetical protein
MKTGYFNTGFVFLRCKILHDINQNDKKKLRGKIVKIQKQVYLNFFNGLVKPKNMGWAEPGPTTWAGLALPARDAEEEEEGGGGEGRRLTCGGVEAVLMVALAVHGGGSGSVFFLSLSPLFFVLFSASSSRFFPRSSPSLLLFSLSLLFLLSSLLFSVSLSGFFFVWSLPCIYKKTGERDVGGSHCAAAPPPSVQHVESGRRLFGRSRRLFVVDGGDRGRTKKSSSSPASRVQGKKKPHSAFKTAPFWSPFFFFLNSA